MCYYFNTNWGVTINARGQGMSMFFLQRSPFASRRQGGKQTHQQSLGSTSLLLLWNNWCTEKQMPLFAVVPFVLCLPTASWIQQFISAQGKKPKQHSDPTLQWSHFLHGNESCHNFPYSGHQLQEFKCPTISLSQRKWTTWFKTGNPGASGMNI